MARELAETDRLEPLLAAIGAALERFQRYEQPDAMTRAAEWRARLDGPLPAQGAGLDAVVRDLVEVLIPNGSTLAKPGFSAFITAAGTTASTLAVTAATLASPQRYGLTAFNHLEELSLSWLAELCGLVDMKGVYSSGGSVANLLALGAARQSAYERAGRDVGRDGLHRPGAIYATREAHHTIQRAGGVLGLGRAAVRPIAVDAVLRMDVAALRRTIAADVAHGVLPIAIVANAGTTNTGAIDPIAEIAAVAREHGIWLHVDGAYGLPGILDPRRTALYRGLEHADSVIVDPHKWLGAATGIAATFVRDRGFLERTFTQEPADYLEGSTEAADATPGAPEHSLDDFGTKYFDYGVELSSPARGVVVWALLKEIGREGMRARIVRHNDMALRIADAARGHPNLELLLEPTLSICCFRYVAPGVEDLDALNRRLHRRLVRENRNLPSTTRVQGRLAIRPCFVGARGEMEQADELVADVLRIGAEVARELRA